MCFSIFLPWGQPSSYTKRLASDERGLTTGKELNCVGNIPGSAPTPRRHGVEISILLLLWVVVMAFGGNPAGSNRINRDAERGKLDRQASSPADLPTLGRHIRTEIREGGMVG